MSNLTSTVSIPASIIFHIDNAMNQVLSLGDSSCSVEPISVESYRECLTIEVQSQNVSTVKLSQTLKVAIMMLNDRTDIGYWFNDLEVLEDVSDWSKLTVTAKLIY